MTDPDHFGQQDLNAAAFAVLLGCITAAVIIVCISVWGWV